MPNVSLTWRADPVDQVGVKPDLRAMVECLLTAHYSEIEIFEYLTGPIGVTEAEARGALRARGGLFEAHPT